MKHISFTLAAFVVATTMFAGMASAAQDPRCIARCKLKDQAAQPACFAGCPEVSAVEMTTCWDGSSVPKTSKCPDRPGGTMKKCPDGTSVPQGQKCPDQQVTMKKCPDGSMVPANKRCPPKVDGTVPSCEGENQERNEAGECICIANFEHFPADGPCVPKCPQGSLRNDKGECTPVEECTDPCAIAAAENAELYAGGIGEGIGDIVFWLKMIFGGCVGIFLLLLVRVVELYRRQKKQTASAAGPALPRPAGTPPPMPGAAPSAGVVAPSTPPPPLPAPTPPRPAGPKPKKAVAAPGGGDPPPMSD